MSFTEVFFLLAKVWLFWQLWLVILCLALTLSALVRAVGIRPILVVLSIPVAYLTVCTLLALLIIYVKPLLYSDGARPILVPLGFLGIAALPALGTYAVLRKRISNKLVASAFATVAGTIVGVAFCWLIGRPWGGFPVTTNEYKNVYTIDYFSEGEKSRCESLRRRLTADSNTLLNSKDDQTLTCVRRWVRSGLLKLH